ncbi:MAG: 4Fe-4S binding protein [Desulfobacteraceae bacterium]|nr:4Fe-4S binding protein [Desulfobacteraceae bacterium]
MKIDEEKCTVCGLCEPYCPMGAIGMDDVAVIDQDECVDCGVCLRSGVCPADAIIFEPAPWPRSLRVSFSDPIRVHKEKEREIETVATNEVTGMFKRGWVGIGLTFGRPGIGTRFRDVEKVAQAMAKLGATFEPKYPVTFLMEDVSTGKIKKEVLNEKVLTVELGCIFPIEKMRDALKVLKGVSKEIDTVLGVSCITRVEPDDSLPVEGILANLGIPYYIWGKQNVGLGRPYAERGN